MVLYSLFSYFYIAIQWCWHACISKRPVQELWLYRSDILCCFWHPVTFSSRSSWLKEALERGGPGAGGGPGRAQPPARGGGSGSGGARLAHKARAASASQLVTCTPFSLLHCDAGNLYPIVPKIQGSFQSGTHYQLALVFSLCVNCAVRMTMVISQNKD